MLCYVMLCYVIELDKCNSRSVTRCRGTRRCRNRETRSAEDCPHPGLPEMKASHPIPSRHSKCRSPERSRPAPWEGPTQGPPPRTSAERGPRLSVLGGWRLHPSVGQERNHHGSTDDISVIADHSIIVRKDCMGGVKKEWNKGRE